MQKMLYLYCCCYFSQSFFLFSAIHCTVMCWCWDILGLILIHPSDSHILRYILSCWASVIYGLPINLQYIYRRVSPLLDACYTEVRTALQIFRLKHKWFMKACCKYPIKIFLAALATLYLPYLVLIQNENWIIKSDTTQWRNVYFLKFSNQFKG